MTCTSNKTVVVRFIRDVLNKGGHRAPSELVAADHALHSLQGDLYGPEGLRIAVTEYRTGFPDLVVDVEEIMADGDWVARRFTLRGTHTGRFRGMPGSGRCIAAQGIGIDPVRERSPRRKLGKPRRCGDDASNGVGRSMVTLNLIALAREWSAPAGVAFLLGWLPARRLGLRAEFLDEPRHFPGEIFANGVEREHRHLSLADIGNR